MKRFLSFLGGLALLTGSYGDTIVLYTVKKIDQAPKIDGQLDDACWQGVEEMTGFFYKYGPPGQAELQSFVKAVFDEKTLYVSIRMIDPAAAQRTSKMSDRDGTIYWDNACELFLDVGNTDRNVYQLCSNLIGTKYDVYNTESEVGRQWGLWWGLGSQWRTASSTSKDEIYMEWEIPFSDFGVAIQEGDIWGFNAARIIDDKAQSTLNAEGEKFDPRFFHHLVFGREVTGSLERLLREELAGLITSDTRLAGAKGFFTYRDYRSASLEALKGGEGVLKKTKPLLSDLLAEADLKRFASCERALSSVAHRMETMKDFNQVAHDAFAKEIEQVALTAESLRSKSELLQILKRLVAP